VSQLALLGGKRTIEKESPEIFTWPIVTREDEEAVLEVLRRGSMSDTDVTRKFEAEFAAWQGSRYALGFCNGTAALQAAMWACRVGVGDEIISPSVTYWASCLPVYSLGGTVVFAEVDPVTLCIDPRDIERRISEKTKAIVVVHYCGHPADMDAIMGIAGRHGLKVIEDVSHAQGGLYKGKTVGTIGDVGAMSLMSGKSFPAGEMGVFVTESREIYDRGVAFGHYDRFNPAGIETEELKPWMGLPLGGVKCRVHQLSAAMARVQLKSQRQRIEEIQRAMGYFWDGLEGVPGIRAHRPPKGSGSTMAGWYAAKGLYRPEELGGLSVTRFCEAVRAEGCEAVHPGANKPLHLHPLFNDVDVYGHGKPTRIANSTRDVRQPPGSLPVSEGLMARLYGIPWFKHFLPRAIDGYIEAFRKVCRCYKELLPGDKGNPVELGAWHSYRIR
jgi:perosamine synthetase